MNLLKEVLKYQVYPAMGCTEPVSVALCAAHAAKELGEEAARADFKLDAGTYKTGWAYASPIRTAKRQPAGRSHGYAAGQAGTEYGNFRRGG